MTDPGDQRSEAAGPPARAAMAEGQQRQRQQQLRAPSSTVAAHSANAGAESTTNASQPAACVSELNLGDCLSIFIFDWDDTLFPTSELVAVGPEKLAPALAQVDLLAEKLLRTALSLPRSHVMLLSSANIAWIYHSAREFLPRVNELLMDPADNMCIVSAHNAELEHQSDNHRSLADARDVAGQKLEVVRAQAAHFQVMIEELGAGAFQVVSLGDSPHDLEAARVLAGMLHAEASYVKTVAMKPRPCGGELVGELRLLSGALTTLSRCPRSYHQNMHRKPQPPVQASPAAASEPVRAPCKTAVWAPCGPEEGRSAAAMRRAHHAAGGRRSIAA
mmetsp:Transcript_78191/g.154982  ORF Transcript_78191/g.154982 Transcript_78191/m.154982 type:complete len:333 (+) Transcript_78191:59-1057(+)